MSIVHGFLYDSAFLNVGSGIDPVRKNGGMCVLSSQALSYFVNPQEFTDPRTARATNLNALFSTKSRLIVDQSEFSSFLSDTQTIWTTTERDNLFAIIDQLCFAYNSSATSAQIELALATWPQYLTSSFVYSTTHTVSTVYDTTPATAITCPDYVTFFFVIANGTQYQLRIWLNNALFYADYPLSTISVVVPPLPLSELYTLSITSATDNVFNTARISSSTSQQSLQSYIQSGQYSGYYAQNVVFVDGSGNSAAVEFNLLYNGCVPGAIAVRTAIRNLIIATIAGTDTVAGVGTLAGWKALIPSMFVTEVFYLVPMWDATTSLINVIIYPNIVSIAKVFTDIEKALYDLQVGYITANLDIMTAYYNSMTVLAVPDAANDPTRLSLIGEHSTYQDVATTNPAFASMTISTQQFSSLLGSALSAAFGNAVVNSLLSTYTPPNDTRSYITFTVADVIYYVMTKASYLSLVNTP